MIASLWECFGVHCFMSVCLSCYLCSLFHVKWSTEAGWRRDWKRTRLIPDSGQADFCPSLMFSAIIRCGEMFTPFSKHNYGNYKPVFPHLGSHEMSSKCGCFLVLIASKYNRCFSVSFCPCLLLFSEVKEKVLSKYSEPHASSIDGCCNNVSGNSNNYNIHTIMCQFYSAE